MDHRFCLRIKKSIRRLKDEKTGAHTFCDTVGRIVSGSFLHFVFSVFTMHILVKKIKVVKMQFNQK